MNTKWAAAKKWLYGLCAALYVVLFGRALLLETPAPFTREVPEPTRSAAPLVLPSPRPVVSEDAATGTEIRRLNLNEADAWMLQAIPGVGEELAARIIAYREAVGGYVAVEELGRVSGIGESTLLKISPYLYVE